MVNLSQLFKASPSKTDTSNYWNYWCICRLPGLPVKHVQLPTEPSCVRQVILYGASYRDDWHSVRHAFSSICMKPCGPCPWGQAIKQAMHGWKTWFRGLSALFSYFESNFTQFQSMLWQQPCVGWSVARLFQVETPLNKDAMMPSILCVHPSSQRRTVVPGPSCWRSLSLMRVGSTRSL
jgi:hypothetical protein